MTDGSDTALFAAAIDWRRCIDLLPPAMATVLVACLDALEPKIGYWDGDRWYSTAGEPIDGAGWWSPLPYAPTALRGSTQP